MASLPDTGRPLPRDVLLAVGGGALWLAALLVAHVAPPRGCPIGRGPLDGGTLNDAAAALDAVASWLLIGAAWSSLRARRRLRARVIATLACLAAVFVTFVSGPHVASLLCH